MAFTTEDVEALHRAIASGERVVEFRNGDRVEYRSVAELQDALLYVSAHVNAQNPDRRRSGIMYPRQAGKGL